MILRNHLVIFARAPRIGTVKRRLAAEIGAVRAWRFYDAALTTLLRRMCGDPRWLTWLALTPDPQTGASRHLAAGLAPGTRVIGQGEGDLGERMTRPFRTLPPGPVVIVGSDIPDAAPAHIERAFAALTAHDTVFGPATDGGYWLVGARRRPRAPRDLFKGVRWSTAHALKDTLANLGGASHALIDTLEDIDTGAAFERWRAHNCRTRRPQFRGAGRT